MKIVGIIFILIGLVMTISIVFAWVGMPLMIVGAIMTIAGGGSKVVVNNIHHSKPEENPNNK